MTENLFMRDEDGVTAVTLPTAGCRGGNCLDASGVSLAMAYVPVQAFEDLYDPGRAHAAGTLFRALDKPFLGKRVADGKDGKCHER